MELFDVEWWAIEQLRAMGHVLQPVLVPLCCVAAWGLVAMVGRSLWVLARDGSAQVQHLHQIPCANCTYFTGDYRLKCPVHPSHALSETAINCRDFQPRSAILDSCES
jgi:hypothetical protein